MGKDDLKSRDRKQQRKTRTDRKPIKTERRSKLNSGKIKKGKHGNLRSEALKVTKIQVSKPKITFGPKKWLRESSSQSFDEVWAYFCNNRYTAVEKKKLLLPDGKLFYGDVTIEDEIDRLKDVCPEWNTVMETEPQLRSPPVLCICPSAIRSAHLFKVFKESKYSGAKLFSKHIKVQEQAQFLKSHAVHFGIGTPTRLEKLIVEEHLCLDQLRLILLDWNFKDKNQRNIAAITEVRDATLDLLAKWLVPLINRSDSNLKLVIF